MMIKSVVLTLRADAAFILFTEKISQWWPVERRHTGDLSSRLFLLASGRFYEQAGDGAEVELGKVLVWEPPRRIVLDFYSATGADCPTEVIITFTPEADGTRVTVTHSPKPESMHLWEGRVSRYVASWQAVLEALASRGDGVH